MACSDGWVRYTMPSGTTAVEHVYDYRCSAVKFAQWNAAEWQDNDPPEVVVAIEPQEEGESPFSIVVQMVMVPEYREKDE